VDLAAGSYIVTLRDANGFIATTNCTIKNNCLKLTGVVSNSTCGNSNGKILVIVANGTAPYLYSVDGLSFQTTDVFTSLNAGTYIFSVIDAAGLTVSTTLTLTDEPGPQMNITTIQASCDNTNGVIQINTSGGRAPLLFSKDNGISFQMGNVFNGLDSGEYLAMVKDASGCTATDPVHLTALATPVFSLGIDTTLCEGESLLLKGPLSAGYQYLWQDNSSADNHVVTGPGTFSLKVTNQSGCSTTRSISVNYSPIPSSASVRIQRSALEVVYYLNLCRLYKASIYGMTAAVKLRYP
jgi:hypothetical protein